MSKPVYGVQRTDIILPDYRELKEKVKKRLKNSKKMREKAQPPKITRLVDRKGEDIYDESYHDQMQELARQGEESYLTGA